MYKSILVPVDIAEPELAEPAIAGLRASSTGRNVFTGRELSAAIAYSSVLSLPVVADTLPPLLAKALNG